VSRKYANDEERRAGAREHQRLRRARVAFERVASNGAQHEEAECMANIAHRLLENMEHHTRAHALETERGCQTQLMIDVARCAKQGRVVCAKDQLQAGHHIALRDLRYPLADPQVDRQVFGRLNEECNHCGSCFWIEKRTGGSLQRPHYNKCCASRKILLPPIRTPPEYMAMLQDQQNAELCKHFRLYNVAFAFTSTRVQSVGFELGPRVHTYKVQGRFHHLIGGMEPA